MNGSMPAPLKTALRDSFVVQCVLGIVACLMLDGGISLQMWAFSMAAFWGGSIIVLIRRARNPTRLDVALIKWGFLALCLIITPLLSEVIWIIRGVSGK